MAKEVQLTTDVTFASARDLAAAIRARRVSAREVLDAHLAHIDRHNPALNAVVIVDADRARERAREADAALARGEVWGPLHGVPFTLKDVHCTAGLRTTVGFPPFANYVPPEDSTVTRRLKDAGGVLVGKTNVAELLADWQTRNPVFGRTNNPWNESRTPGGSSGGATAAVAAGLTPFEIGTDLSASIRLPSAFCGVYGFKPTEQRVPLTGLFPNPQNLPRSVRLMACIGPIARTADDLALLFSIVAGPDGRDTEVKPVPFGDVWDGKLTDLRIAFAPAFPGLPVAVEIREAVQDLAQRLGDAGARVEEARLPDVNLTRSLQDAGTLIGMITGVFQPGQKDEPLAAYLGLLHERDEAIYAWERFFATCDALLCPATMVTAFPHSEPGSPLRVDGRDENYHLVSAYGAVFNYSGHPAVSLPHGRDRSGLPIGVQLVGSRWSDARLLGMARAVSALTEGFERPPGH